MGPGWPVYDCRGPSCCLATRANWRLCAIRLESARSHHGAQIKTPTGVPRQSHRRVRSGGPPRRGRRRFPWRARRSTCRWSEWGGPWLATTPRFGRTVRGDRTHGYNGRIAAVENVSEFGKVEIKARSLPESSQQLTDNDCRKEDFFGLAHEVSDLRMSTREQGVGV